jgi:hypothetical protein
MGGSARSSPAPSVVTLAALLLVKLPGSAGGSRPRGSSRRQAQVGCGRVAAEHELARPGSWSKRGQQQELSRADRDARAAKVAGPYLVRGEKRKGEIWLRVGLWYGYLVDLLKSLSRTEA